MFLFSFSRTAHVRVECLKNILVKVTPTCFFFINSRLPEKHKSYPNMFLYFQSRKLWTYMDFLFYLFSDVDECKEKLFCQCKGCSCTNTWGSYECSCGGDNMLYMREHDTCISEYPDPCFIVKWHVVVTDLFVNGICTATWIDIVMSWSLHSTSSFSIFLISLVLGLLVWCDFLNNVKVKRPHPPLLGGTSCGLSSSGSFLLGLEHMQCTNTG
jgi:hypothetical protein